MRRGALERALRLNALLPACPPVEEAVRLEQLEADLTAALRNVPGTGAIRPALDFALLEEADQLYRFSNLLDAEQDAPAERVTGGRMEITPGRPCVAAHRHPLDAAFRPLDFDAASQAARLSVALMATLERDMAALYARRAGEATDRDARMLFAEMALIEEQHASQYESLWDARRTALEMLASRRVMQSPMGYIDMKRMEVDMRRTGLLSAQERRLAEARQGFVRAAVSLDALSPLKVLGRGYAVASDESGNVLRFAAEAEIGQRIGLRLRDGSLGCIVESRKEQE